MTTLLVTNFHHAFKPSFIASLLNDIIPAWLQRKHNSLLSSLLDVRREPLCTLEEVELQCSSLILRN